MIFGDRNSFSPLRDQTRNLRWSKCFSTTPPQNPIKKLLGLVIAILVILTQPVLVAAQGDGAPRKVIQGLSPEEREHFFSLSRPELRVFIRERLGGGSDIRDQIRSGKFINEKLTPNPRPHYKDVLGMGKIINRMRKKSK